MPMHGRRPFTFTLKSQLPVDGMCPAGYNETVIKLGLGTFADPKLLETRYMNPKLNPEIGWKWMLLNTSFETAVGCTRLFDLPVECEFLNACIKELRALIAEWDRTTVSKALSAVQTKMLADAQTYAAKASELAQTYGTPGYALYAREAELGILSMRKANEAIYTDTAIRLARAWSDKLVTWRVQNRCAPSAWIENTHRD